MSLNNKIMLKETTKMSLHERFTVYRKQNLVQQQQQLGPVHVGGVDMVARSLQQQRAQRQASIKNQRLAQQMANRPTVQAALKIKKRSLRQRLGQNTDGFSPRGANIKSRLNVQSFGLRGRLGGFQNGSANRNVGGRGGRNQGFRTGRFNRGQAFRSSGTSPMLKGRLGAGATGGGARNRMPAVGNKRNQFKRGRGGQRGFSRVGFGREGFRQGQQFRAQNNSRGRGGQRNNRNSTRGGRGFRKGNWHQQNRPGSSNSNNNNNRQGLVRSGRAPSKQDLDNDLDEYMAKTKSSLDAELDAYMAQTE